jgi:hypothetical protein
MSTFVTLKYDPIWRPLEWAKKHCKSYITNIGFNKYDDNFRINYYFGSERDAMLFKLAWSHLIA